MHVYYVFGLLLIFLSISFSTTDDIDNYWKQFDDNEDDYDDYYSEEKSLENKNNNNSNNLTNNTEKQNIILELTPIIPKSELGIKLKETNLIKIKCPNNCSCDEDFFFINCSNRNIESIPKKLPISLTELDLSNNLIQEINKSDLDYLVNLKKMFLNNNEIKGLDQNIFKDNSKLHTINLSNNKINEIDPNVFSKVPSVSVLDLSNNEIKIPKIGSFLNAPKLETLILRNCSINEIYDDTFRNTSGLMKLMLDKNNFNKKINIRAFNVSLQNLVKLKLPELDKSHILELCQILQSIDNISFEKFDLSCFEVVAGLSFNESLIVSGTQTSLFRESNRNQNLNSINQNNSTKLPFTQRPSVKNMNVTNEENVTTELNNNKNENDSHETPMQISSEIINYCLFAIMGIAVIGLIIGVICRKDIYGIKTKLCRTKKIRGPAKTDQIKPAEEMSLNKI